MKSILVVDDEFKIRELLSKHISRKGYKVFVADSIQSAKNIIINENIFCAIIDMVLDFSSQIGGMEVFHFARSNKINTIFLSAIPIQMLKDNFNNEIRENIFDEIERDYVCKGSRGNPIELVFDKLSEIEKRNLSNFVFLSYAREDVDTVNKLYDSLLAKGIPVWFDKYYLLPGQRWKYVITKAIRDCNYFLAVMSNNSVSKTGYVQKELSVAVDILESIPKPNIYLIPIRIEQCMPSNDLLHEIQWVDLFHNWDNGIERIVEAIKYKNL